MKNTPNTKESFKSKKIGEILYCLNKRQRDDLKIFATLPSLHFTKEELKLFQFLLNEIPKKQDLDLVVIRKKSKLSVKSWNYVAAKFLSAVYQYLDMQISTPKQMPDGYPLLKFFREKKTDKNYRSLKTNLEKSISFPMSKRNDNYYRFQLLHLNLEEDRASKKRLNVFFDYNESFDLFYIENKLRLACESLNRGIIANLEEDPLLKLFADFLEKSSFPKPPIIEIFWNLFMMLYKKEKEDKLFYEKAYSLAKKHDDILSLENKKEIYEYLMNFCTFKVNDGLKSFGKDYVSFFKILEENNFVLIDGKITPSKFNNLVSILLLSNEWESGEKFIQNYSSKLPILEQENTLNFNLAKIEFHKENYERAHELILAYHPGDFIKKVLYDKFLLKIYYELGHSEALNNKIQSFRKYVHKNKKLSKDFQHILINFAKYLSLLEKELPFDLESIQNEISPRDFDWFVKKKRGN